MSSTSVAASWPVPNYVNPETHGPAGRTVGGTLISLVSVVIILRMYTRQFISKGFGLDDILILIAYVPATAYAIIGIYGETSLQWNRHIWDVEPRLFVPSLQFSLAELILFDLSTSTTKLSMLAMIHRVTSSSPNKRMNTIVITVAALISVNAFIFLLVTIFQCSPISAYWTITAAPRRCINEATHLLAAGIINTVTDFIIVFLPMQTVLQLKLPRKQRIVVIGLFGAGFLACAAGLVRIAFTWLMTTATNHDKTWNAWAVWIASGIELYVGIICASIPAIKPFFATYLPNVIDVSIRSHKSSRHSRDPKPVYESTSFSQSNTTFQTFIYAERSSISELPLIEPKQVQHKKSSSADQVMVKSSIRPILGHTKSLSANLNKPLPTIQYESQQRRPPMPPSRSDDSSSTEENTVRDFPTQRNARRFTNASTAPSSAAEDRTTIFITYQEEDQVYGRAF